MCTVSMIMEHYGDEWRKRLVWPGTVNPFGLGLPYRPYTPPEPVAPVVIRPVTQDEVDEFRRLLERAREYDRKNNEPDCELAEKRAALKKLAEQLGVEIDFV